MRLAIQYLDDAAIDVAEAYAFYANQGPKAAEQFIAQLTEVEHLLSENLKLGPVQEGEVRF
jgi:plasmid stabilization system protein ParE